MRIALPLCCAGALALQGGVIDLATQSFDQAVGDVPEVTLLFSPFDDAGGTLVLTGVTLTLDATLTAQATAENTSALPNTLTLRLYDGQVQASAPGALDVTAALTGFAPVAVAVGPSDGVPGSGLDFHDFGTVSTSTSGVAATLSSGLDGFLGPDPVAIVIDASGAFVVSGTAATFGTISSFTTSGSVAIRYTFEHLPEPGMGLLLAVGALLCALGYRPSRPVHSAKAMPGPN